MTELKDVQVAAIQLLLLLTLMMMMMMLLLMTMMMMLLLLLLLVMMLLLLLLVMMMMLLMVMMLTIVHFQVVGRQCFFAECFLHLEVKSGFFVFTLNHSSIFTRK